MKKGDEKREHSAKKINMQRNFISQVNVKKGDTLSFCWVG